MAGVTGLPTTADAVTATLACARRLGLPTDRPRVVAEGYSVRVVLEPAPVISRVFPAGQVLRHEPQPWQQREVAVAGYLAGRGAPVVAPWEPAGPFIQDGLHVSLWTWVEQQPGTIGQAEFGSMLRSLHESLSDYPQPLPTLAGPLTDITSALDRTDDAVFHAAANTLLPIAQSWPRQPLHGDAHTANILLTAAGPLWTDFEDVCAGPPEWDLASRTVSDVAVQAYGLAIDSGRLEDCRDLRRLQILAGVLTDDVQDKSLHDELITALSR